MVTLRPMTETEYNAYMPHLLEAYAEDRARNLRESIESQRAEAERQTAMLLPQGIHTSNHFFWRVVTEEDLPVGVLWVFVDTAAHKAFIYDIEIEESYQGHGYGTATLHLLEEQLRPYQVRQIGLNVFGDNQVAFRLYQKVGYYVMATSMQKDVQA